MPVLQSLEDDSDAIPGFGESIQKVCGFLHQRRKFLAQRGDDFRTILRDLGHERAGLGLQVHRKQDARLFVGRAPLFDDTQTSGTGTRRRQRPLKSIFPPP